MAPLPLLAAVLVFGLVFAASGIVSASSLSAAAALVPAALLLPGGWWTRGACLALAAVVFARHAPNIRRMLAGGEGRLRAGGRS